MQPETILAVSTVSVICGMFFVLANPFLLLFLPCGSGLAVAVAVALIVWERCGLAFDSRLRETARTWLWPPVIVIGLATVVFFFLSNQPYRGGRDVFYDFALSAFSLLFWSAALASSAKAARKTPAGPLNMEESASVDEDKLGTGF